MEVTLYQNPSMPGTRMTLLQFRTMIQHAHKKKKKVTNLGAAMKCGYCTKEGHAERECWTKNPNLKKSYRGTVRVPRAKKEYQNRQIRCYWCGEKDLDCPHEGAKMSLSDVSLWVFIACIS